MKGGFDGDKHLSKIKKSTRKKLIRLLWIVVLCIGLKVMDYFFQTSAVWEIVKFVVGIGIVGLTFNLLLSTEVKFPDEEDEEG